MCNAGVGKPQHRRARSVAAQSTEHAPLAEIRRPASADGFQKLLAPSAFVPASPRQLPRRPNDLGRLKPTFFKPVGAGIQQRASTTASKSSCNAPSTLGSLRRQHGTRSLQSLAPISRKPAPELPIKRRRAVRNLLSAARYESGEPDSQPKPPSRGSHQPLRIAQFLSGKPVVF